MQPSTPTEGWESRAIKDVLHGYLVEQRRARRWKIFFRLILATYVAGFVVLLAVSNSLSKGGVETPHVAVVDVKGTIEDGSRTGSSAETLIRGLRSAFEADSSVGVILRINSPGGSPVQSAQVYREILRLKKEHPETPVYAVAGDIAASGAYYIASAADYIYADANSLVGSVGVIMSGFGFSDAMERVGVDRRVYTSGTSKAFMDPFIDENPATVAHVQTLLTDIHDEFIGAVRQGRGDRLNGDDVELFNGLIWTGRQALELGLVDGLGSPFEVAQDKLGTDKAINYSHTPSPLERLTNRISASFTSDIVQALSGGWRIH
jgi:protease-4